MNKALLFTTVACVATAATAQRNHFGYRFKPATESLPTNYIPREWLRSAPSAYQYDEDVQEEGFKIKKAFKKVGKAIRGADIDLNVSSQSMYDDVEEQDWTVSGCVTIKGTFTHHILISLNPLRSFFSNSFYSLLLFPFLRFFLILFRSFD
jgi:hypothetical protein